jgi:cytochrome c peroxidase
MRRLKIEFFILASIVCAVGLRQAIAADQKISPDWMPADESVKLAFKDDVPIIFVSRSSNPALWSELKSYWNEGTETVPDPRTGQLVTRKVIRIKVPLGLTAPPVPQENPMTLAKWILGKKLYFEKALSSDNTVSCASCHDPSRGYTDQSRVSIGIGGQLGGMNAPTVINSAYNLRQFWDGRAESLEAQAQGPVQNPVEMTNEKNPEHAWPKAIERIRAKPEYMALFQAAFGTPPTRDAAAKAIATYERTVLSGNSIVDRAEMVMRARIDEDGGDPVPLAQDFEKVLKDAIETGDHHALKALNIGRDEAAVQQAAASLARGRALFFGKARCNACHVGENYSDNQFHNLGAGVEDGVIPSNALGRFASLPLGHKNEDLIGAFKTPTTRALLSTGPYMHDGSEESLEKVVEFYDRGGIANEYLDAKMRDYDAEAKVYLARAAGKPIDSSVKLFGPNKKPIVPLKLNLTVQEKKDLVLFLRGLEGDPIDPIVADPKRFPEFPRKTQ